MASSAKATMETPEAWVTGSIALSSKTVELALTRLDFEHTGLLTVEEAPDAVTVKSIAIKVTKRPFVTS